MAVASLAFGEKRFAAVLQIRRSGVERIFFVSGGGGDRLISESAGDSGLKCRRLACGPKSAVNQKRSTDCNNHQGKQKGKYERFPNFHLASGAPWEGGENSN